jgi:hypothetical protein
MTEDALIRKVAVVLQSCTLGPCNETIVTAPNSADNVIVMNYEDSTGVNTYGQLVSMPISYPSTMPAQEEVSYVSLRPYFYTFP